MNEIILKKEGKIGVIELNNPEKRNALSPSLTAALSGAFHQLNEDENLRVIILKAAGNSFSAGADLGHLRLLQENGPEDNLSDSNRLKDMYLAIYNSDKIVIAQVEGPAVAGGCGLLTVCDFVFATPSARFGYTEVKIGFLPALVACFLPARIGEARARELLLTGDLIDAQTAHGYGLVNFISSAGNIENDVREFAAKMALGTSPESVKGTKSLLREMRNEALTRDLERAVKRNVESRFTADFKKGISAFLEKKKIEW